jgi:hypothetical protein
VIKKYYGNDRLFLTACALADTPVTRRQATKWGQGRGKAYARKGEARRQLNETAQTATAK